MDNINVNLLAPSTKSEVKTDNPSVKSSGKTSNTSKDTFDNQLSKVKEGKETKGSKSVIKDSTSTKENIKDIPVNKAVDLKSLDEAETIKAAENMILSLLNSVLQMPIEEIQQILDEMNITPTDLLNKDTFKEFLTYAYPGYDENQLLFNAEQLKDVSKLFSKLEQINAFVQGDTDHLVVVENLLADDQVVKTTTTQIDLSAPKPQQDISPEVNSAVDPKLFTQMLQGKEVSVQQDTKGAAFDEMIPEGNLSDEGLLNFREMGLGINIPIQAFNSTVGSKLWDTQANQTEVSQFLKNNPLADQILNKLDITSLGSHKEITMELTPKDLGNLSIKLVENNGVLVANIRVESEKTKELLLSEIKQLEQMLGKQGLEVSEVKVDVRQNPHQSQMEQQKQKSSRRIQEIIDRHLANDQEESSLQVDEATGEWIETEVDYMV